MKKNDLNTIYENSIKKFKENGFEYFWDYIKMCANGNLYKYSYNNQILIYGQKGGSANTLTTYDKWYEALRIPKKGTGIHIFPKDIMSSSSRCVFDVSDTYAIVTQPNRNILVDTISLADMINIRDSKNLTEIEIKTFVKNLTRTNVRYRIKESINTRKDLDISKLEFFSVECCTQLMYKKMNLPDTDDFDSFDLLKEIYDKLSTEEKGDFIIFAANVVNKAAHTMIYRTLEYKNNRKVEELKNGENGDVLGRNSSTYGNELGRSSERTWMRGNRESDAPRRDDDEAGEIRTESSKVYPGRVSADTNGNVSEKSAVSISSREREISKREIRTFGEGISEETFRRHEQRISAGGTDTQPGEDDGGRNSDDRDSLPASGDNILNDVNDEYKQLSIFDDFNEIEDMLLPAKVVSSEEYNDREFTNKYDYLNPMQVSENQIPFKYIQTVVLKGSGFENGKKRIYEYYTDGKIHTSEERIKFLKAEYGCGGAGWPMDGPGLHGYDTFKSKGIRLQWKNINNIECSGVASWKYIDEVIDNLIKRDLYRKSDISLEDMSVDKDIRNIPNTFTYNNEWIENSGNDKERFRANISAISTLKKVEQELRSATTEEQKLIAKYVGWGGLSSAFDDKRQDWKSEFVELKKILTESEYVSARATVNDAFYTPRNILEFIYRALERIGFKGGNILDPALGIGNMFHAMPADMMDKSTLKGVEIDDISARIARLLHPEADIQSVGFENASLIESSFDCIITNVPFGNYQIHDDKYNKKNYYIHDYFLYKSLKLLAPGGILCAITTKGTLDKESSEFREAISEEADLICAVRLPNNTFKKSANTSVTSDLLFFRKKTDSLFRGDIINWIGKDFIDGTDIKVNKYYVQNRDMMLGTMKKNTRFGEKSSMTDLVPYENTDLESQLQSVLHNIPENVYLGTKKLEESIYKFSEDESKDIRNFTFSVIEEKVFFKESEQLVYIETDQKQLEIIKALCNIRIATRNLIDAQLQGCTKDELSLMQETLHKEYDLFIQKYGYINDKSNKKIFSDDVDYPLLCSLEVINDKTVEKAKIFFVQTINPKTKIKTVKSAIEGLNIVVNEVGVVDIYKIQDLYKESYETITNELDGEIFLNPEIANIDDLGNWIGWETAEEYLSGNVREKLRIAKAAEAELYSSNIAYLENIQPRDLDASEIDVKLGTTWIEIEDYEKFIYEELEVPFTYRRSSYIRKNDILLNFNKMTNTYNLTNKSSGYSFVSLNSVYGTNRMNALEIVEALMNLKEVTVKDRIDDGNGKYHYVVNQEASLEAKSKAEQIKEKFSDWVFRDMDRRIKYVKFYNMTFNNTVKRKYNGDMLELPGIAADVSLRKHQLDAVARIIRGGNTLLAHCVGAGKSYVMAAAAMELRRLKLAHKPVIVVPNHLTGQMAAEFLRLYPSADVLLTHKKDFEKNARKKFISKIAMGNYDAVIMGHSQFERVKISEERQAEYIESEINEITQAISEYKQLKGEEWTVKQMEGQKKKLASLLESMQNNKIKDSMISFEELGIDCIMMDEAHMYKNLSFNTKMSNVAGINAAGSMRAMDLFMKIQYLEEKNPGKNIVFATGTPVSNSMSELYTMQRYLQNKKLKDMGIYHFDAWAANFGETVTSMEMAPEGQKYRPKTRFAKFVNLPELMSIFHEVADVKMADSLQLNVPILRNGKPTIVESEPSTEMKSYMDDLVERARCIHEKMVSPDEDNILKICSDARKMSTDYRLIDPDAEFYADSKLYKCVENVYRIYSQTTDNLSTQIIFCDIGTPNKDGKFSVYDYIKDELIKKGIPASEVCFIHDAGTDDLKKEKMFEDMRMGRKRIIIGSTSKMGAGTNIQDKLIAMHEIDVPWRPSDVEQRAGRIIRQGNQNKEIDLFRYVTKGTFDAYNWSIIENKQKFISQIMTSREEISRTCDDIDEALMSYGEMKAIASGNPYIKEKMEVDNNIRTLKTLKNAYNKNHYDLEYKIKEAFPKKLKKYESMEKNITEDIKCRNSHWIVDDAGKEVFRIQINGVTYDDRILANKVIGDLLIKLKLGENRVIGEYSGFSLSVVKEINFGDIERYLIVNGRENYSVLLSKDQDNSGNMIRIKNAILSLDEKLKEVEHKIQSIETEIETCNREYEKPFKKEAELELLLTRQKELEIILSDKNEREVVQTQPKPNFLKKRKL